MGVPRADHAKITRARALRASSSPPEVVLWSRLRNRRLAGLKFRRQHAIGRVVVDFYCADAALVVELDGDQHARTRAEDAARDQALRAQGLNVVRVSARDLAKHEDAVLAHITRVARTRR